MQKGHSIKFTLQAGSRNPERQNKMLGVWLQKNISSVIYINGTFHNKHWNHTRTLTIYASRLKNLWGPVQNKLDDSYLLIVFENSRR